MAKTAAITVAPIAQAYIEESVALSIVVVLRVVDVIVYVVLIVSEVVLVVVVFSPTRMSIGTSEVSIFGLLINSGTW